MASEAYNELLSSDEAGFGIECRHHYGITTHDLVPGETPEQTVYRLMREKWHKPRGDDGGLRDDNHTWDVYVAERSGWHSRVRIIKNAKSPLFVLNPYRMPDGPGAFWFYQEFRVVSRRVLDEEIAEKLYCAERFRIAALREKPTKVGTKRAGKAWDHMTHCIREAQLIAMRWPQYSGLPREGWQARLHEGPNHGKQARLTDQHGDVA